MKCREDVNDVWRMWMKLMKSLMKWNKYMKEVNEVYSGGSVCTGGSQWRLAEKDVYTQSDCIVERKWVKCRCEVTVTHWVVSLSRLMSSSCSVFSSETEGYWARMRENFSFPYPTFLQGLSDTELLKPWTPTKWKCYIIII